MANIEGRGIYQKDLKTLLDLIITNFNGALAKLDADAGVTDTNYADTWDVADTVIEAGCSDSG